MENLNVLGKIKRSTTFSVPLEKEIPKIDNDGNESVKTIPFKIKLTDTARFMATSLSSYG